MSWSTYMFLTLSPEEVEEILDSINAGGYFGNTWIRQSWGWSSECDIQPMKNKVRFSGAEFSRGCTLPNRFQREARKRGFYKRESKIRKEGKL